MAKARAPKAPPTPSEQLQDENRDLRNIARMQRTEIERLRSALSELSQSRVSVFKGQCDCAGSGCSGHTPSDVLFIHQVLANIQGDELADAVETLRESQGRGKQPNYGLLDPWGDS